jgi:hypothetical protein
VANYWQKRAYAELSTESSDLAKRGLVFLLAQFFDVGAAASVSFSLETNGKEVQFEFYDLTSIDLPVRAVLIEGPTYTKFGPAISARNLNRNFSDAHSAGLSAASGISGGTVIASELIGAGTKVGGEFSTQRVHVLKNDTDYVMTFYNADNQPTRCHINLGWSEDEPDRYNLVTSGINSGGVT